MDNQEDKIWLKSLSQGDDSAYKLLFHRYFFSLTSFATKYLNHSEAAEDVVQDVLYNFWFKKIYIENTILLRSFLYISVRNRCFDILRHEKIQDQYIQEENLEKEVEFFLNQMLEEETYILLKKAIHTLPEQTQEVYKLVLLGHNNTEISEMLQLTEDAVKSHRKRGKKILQEKLKNLIYLFPFLFIN
ncbi:MAG: sigma-70 family RNA polymerase sigma factor [Odoribacter sp.]